jgi:hypothetical protein
MFAAQCRRLHLAERVISFLSKSILVDGAFDPDQNALFPTSNENIQEHPSSARRDEKAHEVIVEQPALPVPMETDEAGVTGDIPTETSESVLRRYPLRVREPKRIWPAM